MFYDKFKIPTRSLTSYIYFITKIGTVTLIQELVYDDTMQELCLRIPMEDWHNN